MTEFCEPCTEARIAIDNEAQGDDGERGGTRANLTANLRAKNCSLTAAEGFHELCRYNRVSAIFALFPSSSD